jgi:hypothetical protein
MPSPVAPRKRNSPPADPDGPEGNVPDSAPFIRGVLERTQRDLEETRTKRAAKDAKALEQGKRPRPTKESLLFAIYFAKHASAGIADALRPEFREIKSGENPSISVRGPKRLDVNFSTSELGLGFALSLKSVHRGEENAGDADFIHNLKRNDEELRVEATSHHLRQPYAVLAAVIFLPFESCSDLKPASSFARWVQYLWPLKGRIEPEDPPDKFEVVVVALYARDGSECGFYEVGGTVPCPRRGRPRRLLSLREFLDRITATYKVRNGADFRFDDDPSE